MQSICTSRSCTHWRETRCTASKAIFVWLRGAGPAHEATIGQSPHGHVRKTRARAQRASRIAHAQSGVIESTLHQVSQGLYSPAQFPRLLPPSLPAAALHKPGNSGVLRCWKSVPRAKTLGIKAFNSAVKKENASRSTPRDPGPPLLVQQNKATHSEH
jgi:hypothetical protein